MDPRSNLQFRDLTRRQFFADCGVGVGSVALASLLSEGKLFAAPTADRRTNPLAPLAPHFLAKAKNVIFLFMAGGPSQLELFDHKPKLNELDGQVIPASFVKNQRFAFIKQDAKLLGSRRHFRRWGHSGRRDLDAAAAPRFGQRRRRHHPQHEDRRLQSWTGQTLHQHGLAPLRPAVDGRLDDVRHRQRS